MVGVASCGGHSPTQPTPGGGGGPNQQPPPPQNNLPVIDGITIQGTRPKEPAGFADVSESVDVTARVHDDETPADQLQYDWSATVGTFSGAGAKVTWTAPTQLPGSASGTVTITLKVTEKYGQPGGPLVFEHDVSGTASLSLHDSIKEVGDMARQFLLDFSDSNNTNIDYIMRNFIDCKEAQEERSQVSNNRKTRTIIASSVGPAKVTINFGGVCPYAFKIGDACASVPVMWDSNIAGTNTHAEKVTGTDIITAFYQTDKAKWGLCDSSFDGTRIGISTNLNVW